MARPKKAQHERRTTQMNLRFTAAEDAHVRSQARAAGLSVSEYARRRMLGHQVPQTPGRADARRLTELNRLGLELRAIGNNVNQLARAVHTGRSFNVAWSAVYDRLQQLPGDVSEAMTRVIEP